MTEPLGASAIICFKYDKNGNRIEMKYFGIDGELKEVKNVGAAIFRWKFNEQGEMVKMQFLNRNEEIILEQ